ncbi:MAG: hypothetical protein JRI95_12670 [Deltaproteobacteria bacterium]|nr:hypothetical protein [Deltaproteobacteria bacterium]
MKETADRMKELRKRKVLNYAGKLSAFLTAKKKKAILEADILRNNKEIEYIDYRIEEIQKQLDQKNDAISELEPRIAESKERLNQLRREKQPIEDEYKRLLEIEKNLEEKKGEIEEKKSRIADLTMDIRKGTEELNRVKDRNQQALARKKEIEEEIDSNKARISSLEEEIGVMTSTRDMISGKLPDSIDIGEFPGLMGDQANIEEYVAEIEGIIEKTGNEITTLKAQIEESHTLEKSLSSEKESLQKRMLDLESDLTTDRDKDSMIAEVDTLSEQRERLSHEIEGNREEIKRLGPIIMDHKNSLKREREIESDYRERLEYLNNKKQEMAAFENIEKELERLKNKIQQLNVDTGTNKSILDIINKIKEHVESINMSLDTAAKDYDTVFNEFKHVLLISGHNI